MPFTTIFFDLDHTLWDFETNSKETLHEIIKEFDLMQKGLPSAETFIQCYQQINDQMWDEYRRGLLDRITLRNSRFHMAMLVFGIDNYDESLEMGEFYLRESPRKKNLFPHAIATLEYLREKYKLHIITNGFDEVQYIKLEHSNLACYFDHVITSEAANSKKPEPEIFEYALSMTNSTVSDCIMIGDSLDQDIAGARNYGIKTVYFNPNKIQHNEQVNYEISSLHELKEFL
jgi:putative hydrolase of the HAD superfamily